MTENKALVGMPRRTRMPTRSSSRLEVLSKLREQQVEDRDVGPGQRHWLRSGSAR